MFPSSSERECVITQAPQLLGGPPFDHDTYFQSIQKAHALYIQTINTYWEKQCRADPIFKRLQPAAIALFLEANGTHADPYAIVCGSEPPRYQKGYLVLKYELVPAWTLYLNLAAELLQVVERATKL